MSEEDEYRGEATISAGGQALATQVHLGGYFEPIDGRFHWYGRVNADPAVTSVAGERHVDVVVRTPFGEAPAKLGDPDPWNRYRLTGVGRPPFPVSLLSSEVESST